MLEFITKFFRREESSKTLAKERLRLVLMSDRVSLAPEVFEEMKNEMLSVIRRYLDIDENALDMHFENLERQFALLASIPVLKVKTIPEDRWRLRESKAQPETVGAMSGNGTTGPAGEASTNGSSVGTAPRRRRRRRRAPSSPQTSAEPPAPQDDTPPQPA
jgi:cell division topological specificity factor